MDSGIGKAGGILNIISGVILGIVFALFAILSLTAPTGGIIMFIVFLVLAIMQLLSIIFSAQFLKGKDNKILAGVFGILTGSILGAIFVFVS